MSRLSDGFGFDLLGWLPLQPDAEPTAACLEVKSTRDGTFHLSRHEWRRATWFHERGEGERYVVLVVQRSSGSEPPQGIDILADPVHLAATDQIAKIDDGYKLSYRVTREGATAVPASGPSTRAFAEPQAASVTQGSSCVVNSMPASAYFPGPVTPVRSSTSKR